MRLIEAMSKTKEIAKRRLDVINKIVTVGEGDKQERWNVEIPIEGINMSKPISEQIIERIKKDDARFHANDNISKYIYHDERDALIDELEIKFDGVLRSLVIDVDTDPNSRGTARRLAKMYVNELMSGRYFDAPEVTAFPNDGSHGTKPYHGMLVVRAEIKSMCSHHHQTVSGVVYIGVIPSAKVIGLSKYIRIAQHCARRGTLQEELCGDIANEIMKATSSENVAVYIEAKHGCCENRGIMASNSTTQTSIMHGLFYTQAAREEFFNNIKMQKFSCNPV
jgi:GTP cyclohydrolase I